MNEDLDIKNQEDSKTQNNATPLQEQEEKGEVKKKRKLLFVVPTLLITVIVLGLYIGNFNFTLSSKKNCVGGDDQCKGREDGIACSIGVWCDDNGRVCGGKSCVGIREGQCLNEKCVEKEPSPNNATPALPTNPEKNLAETETTIPTEKEFTNTQIAYLGNCDGFSKGDVWILDTTKQDTKQITTNTKNTTPKWSPNGKKLAWIEDGKNIKIYNYETKKSSYLLEEYDLENMKVNDRPEELRKRELLELHSFDWSPDSKKIAYSRSGVWIKDLESNKERQILKPYLESSKIINEHLPEKIWDPKEGSYVYKNLKYSPNGEYLLFTKSTYLNGHEYNIYQIANGNTLNVIEKTGLKPNHINWSPDSNKILYSGECGGWLGGAHYYNLKTKETKTINQEGTLSSYWLNNANFITITSNEKDECFPIEAGYGLVVLDLKGNRVNTVIPKIDMSNHIIYIHELSPNKKWVFLGPYKQMKQAVPIDGGDAIDFKFSACDLDWRPN